MYKRYSHKLRWYNITLQEKGLRHINDIYKPYIKRNVLDASEINGVIILNI